MKKKINYFNLPSFKISLRYCTITVFFIVVIASLLPIILNYGPESINTPFDIEMSYISYTHQFILLSLAVFLLLFTISKILLRNIDKWYSMSDEEKYKDLDLIKKVRKSCFNVPYMFFMLEIILPVILIILVLFLTGSHHRIMITKILLLGFSVILVLAVYSFLSAKKIYNKVLSDTYSKDFNIGFRIEVWKKLLIELLPIVVTGILITSLIGYSNTVSEKEDVYFSIYNRYLTSSFDSSKQYSIEEASEVLNSIPIFDENNHSKFIILPDESVISLHGPEISNFVKRYTLEISEKHNGRTYDSYGIDAQGSIVKLNTESGAIYVGILFNTSSSSALPYFAINFIILFILSASILYLVSKSLSNDLITVTNGFNQICENEENLISNLPITSNDEISDLISYFNKIQKLQQDYLNQIHDKQDMLMEKERLASLGELIGGISHNLKTPIMSISGAAEGLTDLINEYDASIDDSEVTSEDHHAIANDMRNWIDKMHSYTEYMSDIITAVKGQAVALSENATDTFTLSDLLQRINILMKYEIRQASLTLETDISAATSICLYGDVNSLVQVINNLIANAIYSYNGATGKPIILAARQEEDNLIISVVDHGCGMSKDVQEKLFNTMVTTKGKNGTGLGLFMSYATVKGNFNGDITFTSEVGKGTTFNVIIPLQKQ